MRTGIGSLAKGLQLKTRESPAPPSCCAADSGIGTTLPILAR